MHNGSESALFAGRRVALVHDWLNSYVGGERVLEQMIGLFPTGELFTAFDNMTERKEDLAFLQGKLPVTSFLQEWKFVRRRYTKFLPLLTLGIEQLDVTNCDIVLSSSASIGKGVLTAADQMHVAYVHSPMRYAWDLQHQYLRDFKLDSGIKGFIARLVLHHARLWDLRASYGVDHFIANSRYIAQRIWRTYRREAAVVYPPVDTDSFQMGEHRDDFYLTASRLVPYKKVVEIVRAFASLPDRRLVVIGVGAQAEAIRAIAGKNVELLGHVPHAVLRDHMQRCRAFIFAAEEDFGITPVEAQACGSPVIAYSRGGAAETVRGPEHERPTGLFFDSQDAGAIAAAVVAFDRVSEGIEPLHCRENAERFSIQQFRQNYLSAVAAMWERFEPKRPLRGDIRA